jgi:hypothetical protein
VSGLHFAASLSIKAGSLSHRDDFCDKSGSCRRLPQEKVQIFMPKLYGCHVLTGTCLG